MPQICYQLPTSAGGTGVFDTQQDGDTVGCLLGRVARELGVHSNRLACYRSDGGAALPDDGNVLLGDLRVSWLLRGGKTHGQIGKAGKVRGQTPQVAKAADQPKHKTGRARKRQLYNRRFPGAGAVSFGGNCSAA